MKDIDKYLITLEQEVPFDAIKIIDFPSFRQSTSYSCGASVTQSTLIYCLGNKEDQPQEKIINKLGVTEKYGVDPLSIVRFLIKKGIDCKHGTYTIENLREFIDKNNPVILCIQAWADTAKDYETERKEGHYVVAIGYNNNGIIFEDPSVGARYGFISFDDLDKRWHDIDKNGKRYEHFGIAILCRKKYNPEKLEVIK